MDIQLIEETAAALNEYAKIPMSFLVETIIHAEKIDPDGFFLSERPVNEPYVKDYDKMENRMLGLETKWNLKNWGFISAFKSHALVGCAVISYNTANVHMLEGRKDIAVLWDIRIDPKYRNQGIGSKMLEKVDDWATPRRCSFVKIETQNTNAAACKFYLKNRCVLSAVIQRAYSDLPEEEQFIWHKHL